MEILHFGLAELKVVAPTKLTEVNHGIRSQQMRFIAEARFATPLIGRLALVALKRDEAVVLTELCHAVTKQVMMSIVHEIQLPEAVSAEVMAEATLIELPKTAGRRGILTEDVDYSGINREAALAHGFVSIGGGVIRHEECEDGVMAWQQMMGRVSDVVPVMWVRLRADSSHPQDDNIGRAVLEHRLMPYNPIAAGHRFEIVSAVTGFQGKVQSLTHFMFDLERDRPVFCSQVLSLCFDLTTRKAIPFSAADAAFSKQHLISKETLQTLAACG